jgi:tRNA-(ms[2]io[6]A)-hydroxylase
LDDQNNSNMKRRLDVSVPSPPEWIEKVMNNFDDFLIDHADNERKASAIALSFVAKYPNRTEIITGLIEHAMEELEHFRDVYRFMMERGLQMPLKIEKDEYATQLMDLARSGYDDRFLDRLVLASVMETRGGERFRIVEEALDPGPLKDFYKVLWITEARHGESFINRALVYFPEKTVYERLEYFNIEEGKILEALPVRPRIH